MAFSYPAFAIGTVGGGVTALSPQPTRARFVSAASESRRDQGGVLQGYDYWELEWDRMTTAQYAALTDHWDAARSNKLLIDFRYYSPSSNGNVTQKSRMGMPVGRAEVTDGTGPLWRDVQLTISVGIP